MALVSDFLKVSDALKKNREGVFDLMDARFDRFQIQNDGLRDMYLNNQRIPEELSQTRLNDFNNKFKLETRVQNRDALAETARLNAQFGLRDSRFNNENQGLTQEQRLLGIQSDILTRKNSILEAEAKQELIELTSGDQINPETDVVEYYKNLLRRATRNETRTAIKKKAVEKFQPEIDFMNDFERSLDSVLGASATTRDAKLRQFSAFMDRNIKSGTFETLSRLIDAKLLTERQANQYQIIVDYLTDVNEDGSERYTLEQLLGQPAKVSTPATAVPTTTAAPSAVAPVVAPEVAPVTQPEALPLPDAVTPVPAVDPVTPTLPVVQEPDLFTPPDIPNAPTIDDNIAVINEINSVEVESLNFEDLGNVTTELEEYMTSEEFDKLMPVAKEKMADKLNEAAEKQIEVSDQINSLKQNILSDRELIENLTLTHAKNNPSDPDILTSKNPHTSLLMKQLQTGLDQRLKKLKELEDFVAGVEPEAKLNSDPTANPHPDLFDTGVIETQPESAVDAETRELNDFINLKATEIQQLIDEHKASDQRDIDLMSIPAFANEINLLLKDIEDAEEMLAQLSNSVSER